MNFVDPIRSLAKVNQIKNTLRGAGRIRDLLLFQLGINSALRLSDLLKVQVFDLFDKSGSIKGFFDKKEVKTGKSNRITITQGVKDTLALYQKTYPAILKQPDNYIFFHSKLMPLGRIPIGRKQGWKLIREWCHSAGLKGNFGGHSLRKTFGYQARLKAIPLEIIQHKLNHSSLAITQRYLGITADEIEEACNKLDL